MYQSIIASGKKRSNRHNKKHEFVAPDDDQRFAVVKEMLGNGRLNALCDDGVVRLGRIRGSMRSGPGKMIITKGDLIIVSMRDFEDKVDVVHKYSHDESSNILRRYNLPEFLIRAWNLEDDAGDKRSAYDVVFADDGGYDDDDTCRDKNNSHHDENVGNVDIDAI
jgi:initiation factor 1A